MLTNNPRERVARLLVVLASGLLLTGCGGSGTNGGGPTAHYCYKLQQCNLPGGTPSFICQSVFKRMEMYVIQPTQVSDCIARATCAQIQDESYVEQCLDYDPASFTCNGVTLHFCNSNHLCKDLDCREACHLVPATKSASCGLDTQVGADRCICTT